MNSSSNNPKKNEMPQTADEAFLSLQIIASFKQNSLKINKNDQIIEIYHRHERFLHLILYIILIVLPFFLIKDTVKGMYPMIFLYFLIIILLIWNITRGTKGIRIDKQNNVLHYYNLDFLGKMLHPAKTFSFDEIETFAPEFETGKFGKSGKNMIQIKTKANRTFPVFKIQSDGAGLINGKMVCNALNVLCKKC